MGCTKFTLVPMLDPSLITDWVVRMAAGFICAGGEQVRIERSLRTCRGQKSRVQMSALQSGKRCQGAGTGVTERLKESRKPSGLQIRKPNYCVMWENIMRK